MTDEKMEQIRLHAAWQSAERELAALRARLAESEASATEADSLTRLVVSERNAAEVEVERLKERLHKADGMANEINILTAEVRTAQRESERLTARLSAATRVVEAAGALADWSPHHTGGRWNDLRVTEDLFDDLLAALREWKEGSK